MDDAIYIPEAPPLTADQLFGTGETPGPAVGNERDVLCPIHATLCTAWDGLHRTCLSETCLYL